MPLLLQLYIIQIHRTLILTYTDKNADICSERAEPSNKIVIIQLSQRNDNYWMLSSETCCSNQINHTSHLINTEPLLLLLLLLLNHRSYFQ